MPNICVTVVKTDNGNKYQIGGIVKNTLEMKIGRTYIILQCDVTNKTHPLNLSTTPDGTHGGGTALSGTDIGDTNGKRQVKITISNQTPDTLYYYCEHHAGMGGEIKVIKTGSGFRRRH